MGLSIVEQCVRRLQGEIETLSEAGRGTTIVLRTPLSVLMQRVLLVAAGGRVFALPVSAVERVLRASPETLETIAGQACVRTKQGSVRAVSLAASLGLQPTAAEGRAPLVMVRNGTARTAFFVDELLEEREAFVKELNVPRTLGGLAGGGVPLENRTVAVALNVQELLRAAESALPGGPAQLAPAPPEPRKRRILLADDSLTTRALEKGTLEVHGYEVRAAVDGVEALQALRERGADRHLRRPDAAPGRFRPSPGDEG